MKEIRNEYSGLTPTAERMRRYRARQAGEDIPRLKPGPAPRKPEVMIPAAPSADARVRGEGYALDFISPISHAATEMEKAGPKGASVKEIAETYRHTIHGDLTRIMWHHGLDTDLQATRFLIDRALSALGPQIRECRSTKDGVRYRLAVPFDDLRFEGEQVWRANP